MARLSPAEKPLEESEGRECTYQGGEEAGKVEGKEREGEEERERGREWLVLGGRSGPSSSGESSHHEQHSRDIYNAYIKNVGHSTTKWKFSNIACMY